MKRKKIALFTAQPEAAHERRIIQGVAEQCFRYGYHCLVFSPMTHLEFKRSDYVKAESNIYGLANLDDIDGLILDSVNLLPGTTKDMLDELCSAAAEDDRVFVAVIDMDGLKQINDIYGHAEGDAAIMILSRAVKESALPGEICVRAGGDEFFIAGVGRYTEKDIDKRITAFNKTLEEISGPLDKTYAVKASMGCCVDVLSGDLNLDNVFSRADNEMYKIKMLAHKAGREGE